MSVLDLYCSVDAFWQDFAPLWGALSDWALFYLVNCLFLQVQPGKTSSFSL